jgi:hypothetical protein
MEELFIINSIKFVKSTQILIHIQGSYVCVYTHIFVSEKNKSEMNTNTMISLSGPFALLP